MPYYKYYPCNKQSINSYREQMLFWCKPQYFNDAFDTSERLIKSYPKFLKRIEWNDALNERLKQHGILSLTKDDKPDNRHLWALYSGNYSGFVLEFDETQLLEFAKRHCLYISKVQYNEKPLNLDDSSSSFSIPEHEENEEFTIEDCFGEQSEKVLDRLFELFHLQKDSKVWSIENEYRIIIGNRIPRRCKLLKRGYLLNVEGCIRKVIVGYRMKACYKHRIKRISKRLGIEVFEAEPKIIDNNWGVDINNLQ